MNNVDQSNDLVLADEEDEDDAYKEFLEEEVLDYRLSVDRASGENGERRALRHNRAFSPRQPREQQPPG